MSEPDEDWRFNYFNYFTEVEEHFQRARGTGLFLLSPLDWALIETWKNSGVPLEAVLRGIDTAFKKWRSRKSKVRMINSLAYCTQEVLSVAQVLAGLASPKSVRQASAPFELEELRVFLNKCASDLRAAGNAEYGAIAVALDQIAGEAEAHYSDLEKLERRLSVLEEKMIAIARARQNEEDLLAARSALDRELRPYRGKMTPAQLSMLEKQYLDRRLLESLSLPRLSLFYL